MDRKQFLKTGLAAAVAAAAMANPARAFADSARVDDPDEEGFDEIVDVIVVGSGPRGDGGRSDIGRGQSPDAHAREDGAVRRHFACERAQLRCRGQRRAGRRRHRRRPRVDVRGHEEGGRGLRRPRLGARRGRGIAEPLSLPHRARCDLQAAQKRRRPQREAPFCGPAEGAICSTRSSRMRKALLPTCSRCARAARWTTSSCATDGPSASSCGRTTRSTTTRPEPTTLRTGRGTRGASEHAAASCSPREATRATRSFCAPSPPSWRKPTPWPIPAPPSGVLRMLASHGAQTVKPLAVPPVLPHPPPRTSAGACSSTPTESAS